MNLLEICKIISEEVALLSERELSSAELDDKEHYVKRLKAKKHYFMNKYGNDYEDIIYGLATKMAKEKNS